MKTYILGATLLACIVYSAATTCYDCSGISGDCVDTWAPTTPTNYENHNCTHGCKKVRAEAEVFGIRAITYTRSCALVSDPTSGCNNVELNFIIYAKTTTCICSGDRCNGSTNIAVATLLLVISIAASLRHLF